MALRIGRFSGIFAHPRMEPASPKTKLFKAAETFGAIEFASMIDSIQRTALRGTRRHTMLGLKPYYTRENRGQLCNSYQDSRFQIEDCRSLMQSRRHFHWSR
jgi:hypothetical protein